ncbi:MAG: hypothetical protein GF313_12085, partial [Caldithrix sp.]|nr:hypothetical protein [Caldithrix sp.]
MDFRPKELFYLPNLLSLSRILLIIPIAYLIKINTIMGNQILILLALLIIATDYLDGYFSRKMDLVTEMGKLLDPIADKVAMAVG